MKKSITPLTSFYSSEKNSFALTGLKQELQLSRSLLTSVITRQRAGRKLKNRQIRMSKNAVFLSFRLFRS